MYGEDQIHNVPKTSKACLLIIIPFVLIIFLLSLTPVIERDALIHHLALPKIWLKKGIFHVDSFRIFAFYPSNIQVLYYLALKINLEFLPKFIHSSFLILTAILIYNYIKRNIDNKYFSILAFILIITIPINQRLASESYVDLGLLFFSTLSLIYFLKWKNSRFDKKRYLYISAIGSGLAFGTKYNGISSLVIINLFVIFSYARESKENIKPIFYGLQFFIISFLLTSPWLIRNYYASGGNPFYPLFDSVLPNNLKITEPLYAADYSELLFRRASGESHINILLLPFRLFFTGEDNNFLQFDGKLNPMMLLLLPVPFIPFFEKKSRAFYSTNKQSNFSSDKKYILIFSFFILFTSMQNTIRIRYAIPIVASMVILNIIAIHRILYFPKKIVVYIGYISIAFYLGYNISYTFEIFDRLSIYKYISFHETKKDYLKRKLYLYEMYEFINNKTPQYATIYDILCGKRSYYVDREYVYDLRVLDTYFIIILIKTDNLLHI